MQSLLPLSGGKGVVTVPVPLLFPLEISYAKVGLTPTLANKILIRFVHLIDVCFPKCTRIGAIGKLVFTSVG